MKIGDLIRWEELKMKQYIPYREKQRVGVITNISFNGEDQYQIYVTCTNGKKHQVCPVDDSVEVIDENR